MALSKFERQLIKIYSPISSISIELGGDKRRFTLMNADYVYRDEFICQYTFYPHGLNHFNGERITNYDITFQCDENGNIEFDKPFEFTASVVEMDGDFYEVYKNDDLNITTRRRKPEV